MQLTGIPFVSERLPNAIGLRLFHTSSTPVSAAGMISQAVLTARRILRPHGIWVEVLPTAGHDVAPLGYANDLATAVPNPQAGGRLIIARAGAATARAEITTTYGDVRDEVVVIFGPMDSRLRGTTVETGAQPDTSNPRWFCAVNHDNQVLTPMLHEVMHAANCQHYMAGMDPNTDASRNIMIEATDADADKRTEVNGIELNLLRGAYFYR